jgi:hypothetical protein
MGPTNHLPDAIYERTIGRLRVTAAMLAAVEVALIARAVVDGLNFANGVAGAVIAVMLIASLWLWRTGRRLRRDANPSLAGGRRATRAEAAHTGGNANV